MPDEICAKILRSRFTKGRMKLYQFQPRITQVEPLSSRKGKHGPGNFVQYLSCTDLSCLGMRKDLVKKSRFSEKSLKLVHGIGECRITCSST